jgi:hypothetical protein
MSSSEDEILSPPECLKRKGRPTSPVVRAMVAGCDPLSPGPQTPRPPAVVDESVLVAGLERAHPPPSPAVAMAASVLRHLVAAVANGNEELSTMAASAATAAEYERELYYLSELQAKHHSTCIKHIMMRLQALDTQVTLINRSVYGLQRAVLQLQEDAKGTPKSK